MVDFEIVEVYPPGPRAGSSIVCTIVFVMNKPGVLKVEDYNKESGKRYEQQKVYGATVVETRAAVIRDKNGGLMLVGDVALPTFDVCRQIAEAAQKSLDARNAA